MEKIQKSILKDKRVTTALIAGFIILMGAILAVAQKQWLIVPAAFIAAGYFVMQYVELIFMEREGALLWVSGLVVSADDGKTTFAGKSIVFRVVPIDEVGEVIDKRGKCDFYIENSTSKKKRSERLIVGASYYFAFRKTPNGELSSQTLFLSRRFSAGVNEMTEIDRIDDAEQEETLIDVIDKWIEFPAASDKNQVGTQGEQPENSQESKQIQFPIKQGG